MLLALVQFALFFVRADPAFFWYGAIVLAVGAVVSEIAGVNYNAMLVQVSTPKTIGKVTTASAGVSATSAASSRWAWSSSSPSWTGSAWTPPTVSPIASSPSSCAVWTIVFSIPLFLNVPEAPPSGHGEKVNFFAAYVVLVKDVITLFRTHRPTFWFLLASAVYRDGLAGVFAFGGILAAVAFGFTTNEVLIFAIAANVVAGISTIFAGRADDRFGARAVIITALAGLVAMAVLVFALHDTGKLVFWVGGLILCAFVGPAQASAPSLLARVTPRGDAGRDLRALRHHRAGRELPLPRPLDALHRVVRLHDLGRAGHRHRARPRARAAAARPLPAARRA